MAPTGIPRTPATVNTPIFPGQESTASRAKIAIGYVKINSITPATPHTKSIS